MRVALVSKEVKSVLIEGFRIALAEDGTPSIETVQVSANSASELDKVAKKNNLSGAKVVKEVSGVYAMPVSTFIRIARVLTPEDSRRNLITRTIEYNQYNVMSIDFDEDGKPFVAQKLVEVDARTPEKDVAKMYHAQMVKKSGSRHVLMGCTEEDFLKVAVPHQR